MVPEVPPSPNPSWIARARASINQPQPDLTWSGVRTALTLIGVLILCPSVFFVVWGGLSWIAGGGSLLGLLIIGAILFGFPNSRSNRG